jgi:hypothetical protein
MDQEWMNLSRPEKRYIDGACTFIEAAIAADGVWEHDLLPMQRLHE